MTEAVGSRTWYGELPEHWRAQPLKSLFWVVGGSTPKSDNEDYWDGDIIWVTPSDLQELNIASLRGSQRTITELGLASCGTTLVPASSIVLSTRAPIGSLGIAEVPLCTNQGCKSLVPRPAVSSAFYAYLLSVTTTELRVRGKGTTFLELSSDELSAFRVPVPPLPEQTAIAAFLDRETGKIDALVAEQKRLIELLKEKRQAVISHAVTKGLDPNARMKPSGVEWLGDVPDHWRVRRLKHVLEVRGRIGFRGYTAEDLVAEGEGALTLGGANLTEKGTVCLENRTYLTWEKYEQSPEIKVEMNDILLGQRGTCGRAALVEDDLGPATINPSLVVLKNLQINPRYVLLWLMSDFSQKTFTSYLNKTAVPMLSQEQIGNLPILVPSTNDQQRILDNAGVTLAAADRLLEEASHSVALLQERRSALISAAVTGKIDVRDIAVKEAVA